MQFVEAELIATWGREGANDRLAAEVRENGIDSEQWERFRRARDIACFSDTEADDIRYLEAPVSRDFAFEAASSSVLHEDIATALETLTPRHAKILSLRYGIGQQEHTLQEVADELGITRERVRQIQVKAEERLQSALKGVGYNEEDAECN
jgi:RNA polymerase sigma factor (sigma-70 family)